MQIFYSNLRVHFMNIWDTLELLVQIFILINFTLIYVYLQEDGSNIWVFQLQAVIAMSLWLQFLNLLRSHR